MFVNDKALVLREVKYKEADRILTLLTAKYGKISAKARGALRKSSRTSAATQQLCFSEMTLFFNKGKWTVNEASVIEGFDGLKEDLSRFALAGYFAECVDAMAMEDESDEALLSLALNSLYALSRGMYDEAKIKAAFELRLMGMSGYRPDLSSCSVCGEEKPERALFDLQNGRICCEKCGALGRGAFVDADTLAAMRYILDAPSKQMLSFPLARETQLPLAFAAENYLLAQTERSFSTLDYYKKIKQGS